MEKQVEKKHYEFSKYGHKDRWVSYFHQLDEVLKCNPNSVLEVGVGDRVFGSYLRNNTYISYKSLDLADDLDADMIGNVLSIPSEDKIFDVVCAFEVLEHLPYEKFIEALHELSRVSKKYIIISVPHFGPRFQFFLKIPFMKELRFSFKIPYPKKHEYNGEHYWEIGKKNFPISRIRKDISYVCEIEKEFIPFENQYHHFFILKKK